MWEMDLNHEGGMLRDTVSLFFFAFYWFVLPHEEVSFAMGIGLFCHRDRSLLP